eukprot:1185510-Prorocentrum_minimum.AAC.2
MSSRTCQILNTSNIGSWGCVYDEPLLPLYVGMGGVTYKKTNDEVILLGDEVILLGDEVILLGDEVILLGDEVILLGDEVILLGPRGLHPGPSRPAWGHPPGMTRNDQEGMTRND